MQTALEERSRPRTWFGARGSVENLPRNLMGEATDLEKRTSKTSSLSKGSKRPATVPSLVELESKLLHGLVRRSSYKEEKAEELPARPVGEPPSIQVASGCLSERPEVGLR